MSVLFVCTVNPFLFGGGAQATRAYMDAILDLYGVDNVDVIIPLEAEIPIEYKKVSFLKIPKRTKFKSLYGLLNFQLGRFARPTYELLSAYPLKYNLCIFNSGRESGWVINKLRKSRCKFITIHHNFEVQFCMDTKLFTFGGRIPWLVRKVENYAYLKSDVNLFLTNQDLLLFEKEYGKCNANNYVIGTFDFKSAEKIHMSEELKEFNIAISGSLSDYQTEHGICEFANNYLHILKRHLPGVKILLTGRNPSRTILSIVLSDPTIFSISPSPIDIHKEVRKASFYICPTDIGGGLKLRAMDALKNGLPILVHSVSARGYDYFYDKPYFKTYDDQQSFEEGLLEILKYLNEVENFSYIINRDFYKYFSYKSGMKRMRKALISC